MQLLGACQKSPTVRRLVVKSSTSVYGSAPRDPAVFTETTPPPPAPSGDHAARRSTRSSTRRSSAHLGFAHDGQPCVVPTLHARGGEIATVHGSAASRLPRALGPAGARVPDGDADRRPGARPLGLPPLDQLPLGDAVRDGPALDGPEEKAAALEAFAEARPRPLGLGAPAHAPGAQGHEGARAADRRGLGQAPHRAARGRRGGLRPRRLGRRGPAQARGGRTAGSPAAAGGDPAARPRARSWGPERPKARRGQLAQRGQSPNSGKCTKPAR